MKELTIEVLTDEAMRLLSMQLDDLYATLGGQLLPRALPTRVAGMVSYLSAVRSVAEAKSFYELLPSETALTEWGRGLGVIYEGLKQDGMNLLREASADLRKALCNEDIFHLSDQINRSTVQIVVMVVGAAMRLPRELDAICATVAVILLKRGLRDFCGQCELVEQKAAKK